MELADELNRLSPPGPFNLAESLSEIRSRSFAIWSSQRLLFFTDHRAQTHSEWLIRTLGRLLCNFQRSSIAPLNAAELFILLAACYLHDIGMQDFRVDGRPIEEFTEEHYKIIRRRHPKRGHDLILQPTNVPMPSQSFRLLVALVSQAHGSEYFEDTLSKLAKDSARPADCTVRGGLLSALLLIADELHLHEERALFPEGLDLSPVSSLNFHANHYVTGIEFENDAGAILIRLIMQFPIDSGHYRDDLIRWIVNKLVRQIRRVNPILRDETGGELVICEQVVVQDRPEPVAGIRRLLPNGDQCLLLHDLADAKLVDREQLLATLRDLVRDSRNQFGSICIYSNDESDWPVLQSKIVALASEFDCRLVHISFDVVASMSRADVVARIKDGYSAQGLVLGGIERGSYSESNVHALIAALDQQSASGVLLIIEHPGRADDETRGWMESCFLQAFNTLKPRLGLIVVAEEGDHLEIGRHRFSLGAYSCDDIRAHCQNVWGYSRVDADAEARLLYGASLSGRPAGVLAGLAVRRLEELILERYDGMQS